MKLFTRWLIRRDLPEVLAIDAAQQPQPWNEDEFREALRQRNTIGMVCEFETGPVLGYMIYTLYKDRVVIARLAVHPDHVRRGVATKMIVKLQDKLTAKRRRLIVTARESALPGHMLLRKLGFKAVYVHREQFDDGEDGYRFRFETPLAPMEEKVEVVNRVSAFMEDL